MRRRKKVYLCVFIFLFLGCVGAYSEEGKASNDIKLKNKFMPGVDIDATNSNIKMIESAFDYSHEFKIGGQLPLTLSFNYTNTGIDQNLPIDLPSHLIRRGFGVGTKFPVPFVEKNDRFFVGFDIFPTFVSDNKSIESKAFRIPFRAYFIDKQSEEFLWVLGAKIRPEYDSMVLPIIGFNYTPNDRLTFHLASDDPNISYKLTDTARLRWEFGLENEEYEVTRDNQVNVVLRNQYYSTGLGLQYDYYENVQVDLSVGGVFGRHLEYADDSGKVIPDSGMYAGLGLSSNF